MYSIEDGCQQKLSVNGVRHWRYLDSAPGGLLWPCSSVEDSPSRIMCLSGIGYVIGRERSCLLFVG